MQVEGLYRWWRGLAPKYGPHYGVAAQGVVRGLGLIYILSFWSYAAQIFGLSGPAGLVPVPVVLDVAERQAGWVPTLFQLSAEPWVFWAVLVAGAAGGFCMLYGLFPWGASLVSWICWGSLVHACQPWLSGTGDLLLLETGLLALGLMPWRACSFPPPEETASRLTPILLLNALLFKTLWMRGMGRLTGEGTAWLNSTALFRYFETQPLPSATAWYVHHLPEVILKNAVWVLVFIEVALVFYILLPRTFRNILAGAVSLQALVFLVTGQHGFTPLLLILLAFSLVDDVTWRRWLPDGWGPLPATTLYRPGWKGGAVLILWLPLLILQSFAGAERRLPPPWRSLETLAGTVHVANRYTESARVSARRYELAIQGSVDGRDWIEYRFKLKPTDVRSAPPFSMFHYPRLDERMAMLARRVGREERVPPPLWLPRLARHLMLNHPSTLSLFPVNPFPEQPPRFIRVVLYEYRFADPVTRRETGQWWQREFRGFYGPVFRRGEGPRPVPAAP